MNITFSAYIATSLDGYIARPNGGLDWLDNSTDKDSKEDYGYHDFMTTVDCLVMGRSTFEKVASFPEWPYQGKRVIVISKKMNQAPAHLHDRVEFFNGKVEQLVVELQSLGVRKVYVDGGFTIQSFINAGLLDEIIITQIPILIGKGISLFGDTKKDHKLKLLQSRKFDSGFVQSHYQFLPSSARFFD
ncbi:dihydrofolate reductase family protein [Aliikangiella sp. G2MR2-5]|uniref:dihydrofolate reductase family protein n=1 Tax=Aliikangiella sp. G2MR2-5 TaxID=2788943 RepID=UPI001AEED908|nr:dihydrofolate reductase family protein [Aliikangiella sp. G2MR2-5]